MRMRSERGYPALIAAILMLLSPIIIGTDTSAGASPDPNGEPNDLRWDLAKNYQFAWESVQLSSSLSNPANTDPRKSGTPQRILDISLQVDILNTKEVVGIDVSPVVLGVLDGDGRAIPFQLNVPGPDYEPLAWNARTGDVRDWPASLLIRLPFDPNQTVPRSLSSLKGYIRFLHARDKVEADIPYAAGDWIEVLPDLEIRLTEGTPPPPGPLHVEYEYQGSGRSRTAITKYTSPLCVYSYGTSMRSKSGGSVFGLGTRWWPSGTVVDYALIKTELVDPKERVCVDVPFVRPAYTPEGVVMCTGDWDQDFNSYDTIRHRIAVKPYEAKVPFVLKDIPVPTFQPANR